MTTPGIPAFPVGFENGAGDGANVVKDPSKIKTTMGFPALQ
jgi:hypothetical protein